MYVNTTLANATSLYFSLFLIANYSIKLNFISFSLTFDWKLDIDQWNKVTELLSTPPQSFFDRLQPSVRFLFACFLTLG